MELKKVNNYNKPMFVDVCRSTLELGWIEVEQFAVDGSCLVSVCLIQKFKSNLKIFE
jgi:hypothetical protein